MSFLLMTEVWSHLHSLLGMFFRVSRIYTSENEIQFPRSNTLNLWKISTLFQTQTHLNDLYSALC